MHTIVVWMDTHRVGVIYSPQPQDSKNIQRRLSLPQSASDISTNYINRLTEDNTKKKCRKEWLVRTTNVYVD